MSVTQITVKVYEFDESSNSLIVAFKSNNSSKNIDEYPKMAYQPTMFEETDPEEVFKKIAASGVSIAEMQDKQETLSANNVALTVYKEKVGQTYEFLVSEIIPPPPQPVPSDI